jgi:type II secretory pathway component PulM
MTDDLVGLFVLGGGALSVVSPTGGRVLMNRAGRASDAVIELAKHDERVEAWLRRFLTGSRYMVLGNVVAEVVVAVGVDRGIVPPTSPLTGTIQPEIAATMDMYRAMQAELDQQRAEAEAAEAEAVRAAQQQSANGTPTQPVYEQPAPVGGE